MFKQYKLSGTSPSTATINAPTGQEATNLDEWDWFTVDAVLTGATGGTLDVCLQRWVPSAGAAGEWWDWVRFAQLSAAAAAVRVTFDSRMAATSLTTTGGHATGAAPVLAASTMAPSHPGHKVRLFFSAGASTSAGAAQQVILTAFRARS